MATVTRERRVNSGNGFQTVWGVAGATGSDAAILVLLAFLADQDQRSVWVYVGAILAIAVPAACAAWCSTRCEGATKTTDLPCQRIRQGIFVRCQSHKTDQRFTSSDGWALIWLLLALFNTFVAASIVF